MTNEQEMAMLKALLHEARADRDRLAQERNELRDWQESAINSLLEWHALGDVLMELTPLTIGDNIPTKLAETVPAAFDRLAQALAAVRALPEQWKIEAHRYDDEAYIAINQRADQLSAVLASVPSPWQPIDTAPKDGTDVLLGLPTSVDIGSWQEEQPDGMDGSVVVDPGLPGGWYGYLGLCPWEKEQPTHWQPLPKPPAVLASVEAHQHEGT